MIHAIASQGQSNMATPSSTHFPGELGFISALVACAILVAAAVCYASRYYQWLTLYAAGIALLCYAAPLLRRQLVASRWPSTEGVILHTSIGQIEAVSEDEKTRWEFFPVVKFEYSFGSGVRQSRRFSASPSDLRSPSSLHGIAVTGPRGSITSPNKTFTPFGS